MDTMIKPMMISPSPSVQRVVEHLYSDMNLIMDSVKGKQVWLMMT